MLGDPLPTAAVLVHQLQVADSRRLKFRTHFESRPAWPGVACACRRRSEHTTSARCLGLLRPPFRGRLRLTSGVPCFSRPRGGRVQLETMYSTVDDRVATVMLNRPHVLNCTNEQWARDLNTIVDDLAGNEGLRV